ncbi:MULTISPECIES: APC family permease [Virgibacillus]|uniref:Putative amino acid permease YhdG n=1 Tax=Virgibacillus dokdonensis TaxID=302167 RepID=A0A2K9J5W6_9BACI|nr:MULTISPECIES: APC family permease [Virgibacillus]AUJ25531.1 putative amino acid permease YhdG [Virgibacillus dokdonensis]NWO14006.1 APC family permease [Virgibacillus sp.]
MENREQLTKSLKPHWVWAIAFGSAIGWGAFVLPVDWMSMAGPLGVILGFIIGAILMIIIGVSYGFLVEKLPVSGGEFTYAYYGLGRYHAFLCGWFLTLGYLSIVALNASALALLGKFLFPTFVETGLLYSIAGWDVYAIEVMIACIGLTIIAWLNIRGARITGFSQFLFCIILLSGVLLLTITMLFHSSSSFSNLQPLFKPEIGAASSIFAIVAIAPWAFIGFDNIPQAAEEFHFSPKKTFKIIVLALVCSAFVYCLTIIATGVSEPWANASQVGSAWGTGTIVENAYGKFGVFLLAIALIMGIFTGLNGFYMSTSRLLFAMGRAKVLPAIFGKLHTKHRTPHVGIIFTLLLTAAAPFFGREALLWVVDMSALGVTIAYFYACFVAYRIFAWSRTHIKNNKQIVAPKRKFFSLLGILCAITFFLLLVVPGSPGFLSTPSWIALLVWILLGIIFFLIRFQVYSRLSQHELDYSILGAEYIEKQTEPAIEKKLP